MSPDNKSLVATYIAEIRVIDIGTGDTYRPFHTTVEALMPDWSADGNLMVHVRGQGVIADSGGIHIYDMRTHADRPLKTGNGRYGIYPRWLTPNCIVYFEIAPTAYRVVAVDTSGNDYRVLYEPPTGITHSLQTFREPRLGPKAAFGHLSQAFVTGPRGGLTSISRLKSYDLISPDGQQQLTIRQSPRDTAMVVYIMDRHTPHPRLRELTHFKAVE